METISVIIPVFNAENFIERCVKSLLAQSYEDFELVIVDDGSTDGSIDIIRTFADDRIKLFRQKNAGSANARNTGLKKASGDYVTFVDADDYVEPDYLMAMLDGIKKYKVDICSCRAIDHHQANLGDDRAFPEDGKTIVLNRDEFDFFDGSLPKAVCCVLFKKDIISGIWFDADIFIGEDTIFFARALHKAKNIAVLHKNLYHYIIFEESTSHGAYDKKKITEFCAWRRVAKVFKDVPSVYETIRARYADRCLKVIRRYHFKMGVNKKTYYKILKEYRKNLKYIVRCTVKKHKLSDFLICMAYIVFAVFPSLYPQYYRFRYREIS